MSGSNERGPVPQSNEAADRMCAEGYVRGREREAQHAEMCLHLATAAQALESAGAALAAMAELMRSRGG